MDLFDLVAKLTLDTSGYESDLAGAETKTNSFASSLGSGLSTATKGVATAIAGTTTAVIALGGAITASAVKTAEYGDNIDKSSQKMGVSAKFYQEWDAVLQHSGTSMDSMSATFKTLSKAVQDGSDDQQKAFQKLGLSMDDLSKMSTEEVFEATIAGLQNMEEGTERTALATQLLGRGAMEMGALLNTSADDTQAMIDQVNALGGVMSDDAVKASARFEDSLQDLQTGFKGMGTSIMSDIIPNLTDLMDFMIDQLPMIKEVVSNTLNGVLEGVSSAFAWIEEHFDQISAVIQTTLSVVSTIFGATWDACKVIFDAIGQAISDVTGDVDGAGVDWQAVAQAVASAIKIAGELIAGIIKAIGAVIGWLVNEAQTDGSLINTIFNNIKIAIQTSLNIVKNVLNMIIALLKGDWKTAFESAKNIVTSVFNGIKNVITNTMNGAKTAVQNAINAIKNMFNFTWSLPPLKLPHFSISGSFSLKPPSVPSISVDWYKKAMDDAMILDGATIFGSAGGNLLGGGEAGREVIAGESHLMDMIQNSVDNVMSSRLDSINSLLSRYLPEMGSQKIVLDTGALVGQTVGAYDQALGRLYTKQARYV